MCAMKTSDDLLLKRIGGYSLLGKTLGKGSFARVELANHVVSNIKVALKLINLEVPRESYLRKNVLRESTILKNLRHENVVRLYETLAYHKTYCFVTEYLPGGSLLTYLQNQKGEKRLSEKQARRYFTQLLSAVQYLHSKGIIHRDLKMQNIMLTENKKTVKLIDFGLSNYFDKDNLLQTQCGSAEYAAPELFDTGTNYGPSVEIWSLGVILFALTTGKMPFQTQGCEKKENFIVQVRRGINISHEAILKRVSTELKRLLILMLEPDRDKRISLSGVMTNTWVTENGRYPLLPSAPDIIPHSIREKIVERVADLYSQPIDTTIKHLHSKQHDAMDATFQLLLDKTLKFHKTKTQRRSLSAPNKVSRTTCGKKLTNSAKMDKRTKSAVTRSKYTPSNAPSTTMNNETYPDKFNTSGGVSWNQDEGNEENVNVPHSFSKCLQISKTTKFASIEKSRCTSPTLSCKSSHSQNKKTAFRLSPCDDDNRGYAVPNSFLTSPTTKDGQHDRRFYDVLNHKYGTSSSNTNTTIEGLPSTTIEGVFHINSSDRADNSNQSNNCVNIESNNVKVTISGEQLESASFRITTEQSRNQGTKCEVGEKHTSDCSHRIENSTNRRRSLSPFQARQMLHRYTYPLHKPSLKPDHCDCLVKQVVYNKQIDHYGSAKDFVRQNQHNIEKIKKEVKANIITTPQSISGKLIKSQQLGRSKQHKKHDRNTRCNMRHANEILSYESELAQTKIPVYSYCNVIKEKRVTFK